MLETVYCNMQVILMMEKIILSLSCLLKKTFNVYDSICTISCVIIIINYFQRKRCIFYFAINAGSCTLQNICLKAYNNY